MNKLDNDLPPSYEEAMGSAPDDPSLECSSSLSTYPPSRSHIGFENINIARFGNPTLFPYNNFDAKTDTAKVLDAITSNSDDNLAELLSQRTASQREKIDNLYFEIYNKSLVRDIEDAFVFSKSRLLLEGLSVPYYVYLARSIKSCKKFKWLYYILFTIPSNELEAFQNYFVKAYKSTAYDFLSTASMDKRRGFNFDPIRKLLKNTREDSDLNDKDEIYDDVAKLKQLDDGSFFGGRESEEFILNEIFLKRSFSHIKQVCEHYQTITGVPIQIMLNTVCNKQILYKHIAGFALNPAKYYAIILNKEVFMEAEHDEYLFTHIFIRRSEIDLYDIKTEFNAMSKDSLSTKIQEKISFRYRRIILQLLGEPEDWSSKLF